MSEKNITDRLEEAAIDMLNSAQYYFTQHQSFYALNRAEDNYRTMIEAANVLRNLGVGKPIFGENNES